MDWEQSLGEGLGALVEGKLNMTWQYTLPAQEAKLPPGLYQKQYVQQVEGCGYAPQSALVRPHL